MDIPAPVVEVVDLARLVPWPKNPRKGHAVDEIQRSIEAFGYLAPMVVQARTYRILAGHGRLEALKRAGVTRAPVIVADIDDARADLYTIADNKLTERGEWDFAGLADMLLEFDAADLDVTLTGFSDRELEDIAGWTPPAEVEEEALAGAAGGPPAGLMELTFVVTPDQAEAISRALRAAREAGPFVDTGNENENGNALERIAEAFLGRVA